MNLAKFKQIEDSYRALDRELLKQGRLPMRPTPEGFWSAAIAEEIFEAFQKLGLRKYRRFLDLGSGDGRVTLIASLFVPQAEGVEIDPELHQIALAMKRKLGLGAAFHLKNLFAHDLSGYDVLFLSPDAPLERGMEKKLLKEMEGALIHHGHHFHPAYLKKKETVIVNGTPITLYVK